MPNRILKDSICTSPNIDGLSRDAEVFFYRLIVQCDDFGRMDARPPILRARCYPLQIEKVNVTDITKWLSELVAAELIALYTVENLPYVQMRTWERHQQVRAKRSKYPEMISIDINCNQVITNVPVIQSNPIQCIASDDAQQLAPQLIPEAPSKPRKAPNSAQQDMFGAIADTCELDAKLKQGAIAKTAKSLLDAGYTPEQVRGFKTWWQSDPWRVEHTPVPSMAKLIDQLHQFRNSNGAARPIHANGNGIISGGALPQTFTGSER